MRNLVIVDPGKMDWSLMTEGPSSGIMVKIFSDDDETGAFVGLAKLPAGSYEPKHSHPCGCDILIMQGKLVNTETGQEISKGMYWHIPKGEFHGPLRVTEDEECILFIVTDGPVSTIIES